MEYRGGVAPLGIAPILGRPDPSVEPHPPELPREAMSARPNRTPGPMSYRVPTDGSSYQMKLGWTARSVEIVNSSTQVLTLTNDMGDSINCGAGGVVVVPTMPSFMWTAQLQGGPSTNNRAAYLFFFPYYRPTLSGSLAGGSAVTVTNFPATQPVTVQNFPASQPVTIAAPVAVSNFPATQQVASVDGALAAVGATADAAQTGAAGSVIAQLKGLFARIIAAGDAVAGAVGMLAVGLWDGAATTRQRAVSAAGNYIGVAAANPPARTTAVLQGAPNAAAVLTIAAVAGQLIRVHGITLSTGQPITAAVTVTLQDNATTTLWETVLAISAATLPTLSPIHFWFGEGGIPTLAVNHSMVLTVPALGVGVNATLTIVYSQG